MDGASGSGAGCRPTRCRQRREVATAGAFRHAVATRLLVVAGLCVALSGMACAGYCEHELFFASSRVPTSIYSVRRDSKGLIRFVTPADGRICSVSAQLFVGGDLVFAVAVISSLWSGFSATPAILNVVTAPPRSPPSHHNARRQRYPPRTIVPPPPASLPTEAGPRPRRSPPGRSRLLPLTIGTTSIPARQHPGQRELRRRAALCRGDALELRQQRQIVPQIVAGEPRHAVAHIAGRRFAGEQRRRGKKPRPNGL